jgi:hypothetical protein
MASILVIYYVVELEVDNKADQRIQWQRLPHVVLASLLDANCSPIKLWSRAVGIKFDAADWPGPADARRVRPAHDATADLTERFPICR